MHLLNTMKSYVSSFIPNNSCSFVSTGSIGNYICAVREGQSDGKKYYKIAFSIAPNELYKLSFSEDNKNEIKIKAWDAPAFSSDSSLSSPHRLVYSNKPIASSAKVILVAESARKIIDHIMANKKLWPSLPGKPWEPCQPYSTYIATKGEKLVNYITHVGRFYPEECADLREQGFHIKIVNPSKEELEKYEIEKAEYPQKLADYKQKLQGLKTQRIAKFHELVLMTKNACANPPEIEGQKV